MQIRTKSNCVKRTMSHNVFDISEYFKGAGVDPLILQRPIFLASGHYCHRKIIISDGKRAKK